MSFGPVPSWTRNRLPRVYPYDLRGLGLADYAALRPFRSQVEPTRRSRSMATTTDRQRCTQDVIPSERLLVLTGGRVRSLDWRSCARLGCGTGGVHASLGRTIALDK